MPAVYADEAYYLGVYGGTSIEPGGIATALSRASRHIDSLTFNRIVGRGFDNLTAFQQSVIRQVACGLADFEEDNAELIGSVLAGYSINGVSMQLSRGWNIHVENGVAMPAALYGMLAQTGLTCRLI